MSLAVVGSIALDTVETPWGKNENGLGGAAVYFALAASNFAQVHLVGVVGDDFPQAHIDLLASKGIDLEGLEKAPGKTFRWAGRYHKNVNQRDTLDTQLNVFEQFHPKLPANARAAKYLFLGNIHPGLQLEVLDQTSAEFVALDTMNLWINTTLEDLKTVLNRVDAIIINDSEVHDLTGESNVVAGAEAIRTLGPKIVVVKKGEHGCLLFEGDRVFAAPAIPLKNVTDPTGAGDTFAGGFMGHIAHQDNTTPATLREAVVYGTIAASYTCEAFGPNRLAEIGSFEIASRLETFRELIRF